MAYSASDYVRSWMMHRAAIVELLEKLPDDKGDFAAWEGGMSFTKMVDHLAGATLNLTGMMAGKERVKFEPSPSLSAATARLKEATGTVQQQLSAMNSEQLSTLITAFGQQMPAYALLDFLIAHDAHHKGQLWMMARMNAIEPPRFVKFG
ncbi:MAG: DinB family protein [Trueperaceae bacterium]